MTDDKIITTGFVVFAEQGPGDPATFLYTIDVNMPNGTVKRFQHVKPAGPGWQGYIMEPAPPDAPFPVTIVGDQMLCWIRIHEVPANEECEE